MSSISNGNSVQGQGGPLRGGIRDLVKNCKGGQYTESKDTFHPWLMSHPRASRMSLFHTLIHSCTLMIYDSAQMPKSFCKAQRN